LHGAETCIVVVRVCAGVGMAGRSGKSIIALIIDKTLEIANEEGQNKSNGPRYDNSPRENSHAIAPLAQRIETLYTRSSIIAIDILFQ
jgi:hypothetical protein